tara:strand:- start:1627 stop:1980 length:354 start_codon:yes stop_codon:yes gene_type:complete
MISKNSINRVILVGHVGQDPDVKYTTTGHPVASFSLATNELRLDVNKNKVEHVEWHSLVAWNRLAEFIKEYVTKGQLLYIEGKIHSKTWVDKNNIRHRKVEVLCESITPLDWKKHEK